jgi:hypothetical protein
MRIRTMEQLTFLNKFLVGYGIQGLSDNETKISQSAVRHENDLIKHVNDHIPEIKKLFKTGSMNLGRKNYKVDSIGLAFSVLKHCLKQANVPYESVHTKTNNSMRLIPVNNLLVKYIEHPMNHILHPEPEQKQEKVIDESMEPYDIGTILNNKTIPFVAIESHQESTKNWADGISRALIKLVQMNTDGVKSKRTYWFNDTNVDFILTTKNIIMRIRLDRYSDVLTDLSVRLIRDSLYLDNQDQIIEKIWLVIGNVHGITLCDDLLELKNNPFPIMGFPHHNVTLNIYMKPNTCIQKLCAEVDIIDCHLNQTHRKDFFKHNPFQKYNGKNIIDYRKSQCLIHSDDLMLDHKPNIIRFIIRDRNYHDFPIGCKITDIWVGVCDTTNNYELVDNYVCYVKISGNNNDQIIDDGGKIHNIYEEMIKHVDKNIFTMHRISAPVIDVEKYLKRININTFYDLKPNHCIVLEYMYAMV